MAHLPWLAAWSRLGLNRDFTMAKMACNEAGTKQKKLEELETVT